MVLLNLSLLLLFMSLLIIEFEFIDDDLFGLSLLIWDWEHEWEWSLELELELDLIDSDDESFCSLYFSLLYKTRSLKFFSFKCKDSFNLWFISDINSVKIFFTSLKKIVIFLLNFDFKICKFTKFT